MTENNKKLLFKGLGVLVVIALFVYLASFLTPKLLVSWATMNGFQKVSSSNSFIMGEKVLARADGEDKCVVDVFVIDTQGKGIKGKTVQMKGLGALSATTDDAGKAVFELKTDEIGQYDLTASVNGLTVAKMVKVIFVE